MKIIIRILLLIFVFALFTSCKTKTLYVPIETVKIEYKDRFLRDSVHLYDSIFVMVGGDTVRIEKYKYLYRERLVRDSIFRTDSIAVPYPVVEVQEVNRLHNWQIILMCLGGVLIGYIGFRVIRKIKM